MKNRALFSLKDKSKKLKCHLLQFLFGALRAIKKKVLFKCNRAVLCSARQSIHMNNKALFSSKDKSKQEMLQYVTNAPEGPL